MTDRSSGGRRPAYLAAAATAVLALTGVGILVDAQTQQGPPQPSATAVTAPGPARVEQAAKLPPGRSAEAAPNPDGVDLGPVLAESRPVSLDIPSISVHADQLVDLAYTDDGALEAPEDFDLPGWFTAGPTPGQFGPAVIAGHVDSKAGPAIFYRLASLRSGATVRIGRADGSTATFRVDRVERYPKDDFPTAEVYGNTTDRAELRLITCGGSFDRSTGHYRDNVVAYAHLTA